MTADGVVYVPDSEEESDAEDLLLSMSDEPERETRRRSGRVKRARRFL